MMTKDTARVYVIVTDVMMADLDGFAFADRIREHDGSVAIIFMTAWPTTANAVDAVRHYGGLDYLEKPIDEERLLAAVEEGIGWARERRRHLARTSAGTQQQGGRRNSLSQPQDSGGPPVIHHDQDGHQRTRTTHCASPVSRCVRPAVLTASSEMASPGKTRIGAMRFVRHRRRCDPRKLFWFPSLTRPNGRVIFARSNTQHDACAKSRPFQPDDSRARVQ